MPDWAAVYEISKMNAAAANITATRSKKRLSGKTKLGLGVSWCIYPPSIVSLVSRPSRVT